MTDWWVWLIWALVWFTGIYTGWFMAKAMEAKRMCRGYDRLTEMAKAGYMPEASDVIRVFDPKYPRSYQ